MCIVQFEPNGGTFIEHQEIKCGTIISEPNKPQKAGFSFKYWEYNGEKYDFSKGLYAVYAEKIKRIYRQSF